MIIHLAAIGCVFGLALLWMFLAVFAVAACVQSGRDADAERLADALKALPASANWDYLADDASGQTETE